MDSPLPDGLYATISHNPGISWPPQARPTAFPWRTTIYEFRGGMADERGSGSNAGDMLSRWNVAKVFLIGLDSAERAELNKTSAKHDIELTPDPAVEAKKKRGGLVWPRLSVASELNFQAAPSTRAVFLFILKLRSLGIAEHKPLHFTLHGLPIYCSKRVQRVEQMILVDVTHPCPKNPPCLQRIFRVALHYEACKSLEHGFKPRNRFESHPQALIFQPYFTSPFGDSLTGIELCEWYIEERMYSGPSF